MSRLLRKATATTDTHVMAFVHLSACGNAMLPHYRIAELSTTFDRLRPGDFGEKHCTWVLVSIAVASTAKASFAAIIHLPARISADFVALVGAGMFELEGAFLCIRRQQHIESRRKLHESKNFSLVSLKPACEYVVRMPGWSRLEALGSALAQTSCVQIANSMHGYTLPLDGCSTGLVQYTKQRMAEQVDPCRKSVVAVQGSPLKQFQQGAVTEGHNRVIVVEKHIGSNIRIRVMIKDAQCTTISSSNIVANHQCSCRYEAHHH